MNIPIVVVSLVGVLLVVLCIVVLLSLAFASAEGKKRLQIEKEKRTLELEMAMHIERSLTDTLTGLQNRRSFDQEFKREMARAVRFGHNAALLFLDLDNFKDVNDKFGHPEGDKVLVDFAAILQEVTREADATARYGGDEFALLLPETDRSGAAEAARKLLDSTRKHFATYALPVTCSIGIATVDEVGPQGLIRVADERMYTSKVNGGDRFTDSEGVHTKDG